MIFDNTKKLGFGTMRLPLTNPSDDKTVNIEETKKMIDYFIDNGFTYFDTASMYHKFCCEKSIKEALIDRYPRDKFTVSDKMHHTYIKTAEDCERVFNEQLKNLGVKYFDYYLVHAIGRSHYVHYNNCDVFNFVKKKKEQGFIKHLGFSFHDNAEFLEQVLREHPEMEFVQLQINYLDFDSSTIQSRKCYEVATKFNKPVIVMEPVKGGTLARLPFSVEQVMKDYNKESSIASWAIRFVASLPNVKVVLSGMSNMNQMKDNVSFMKDFKPLNNDDQKIVSLAVSTLNNKHTIACTGCSYCSNGCPKKIPIPKYFSLYNLSLQETGNVGWNPEHNYYHEIVLKNSNPSDCICCKQCESVCPQKLKITELLKKVKDHFEG